MEQNRLLKHFVAFKFHDHSSDQEVKHVVDAFVKLKDSVQSVHHLEWGVNMSPENFHQGFTHCFTISFRAEADLANYQRHPSHMAFQDILKPHMDKVFVVDFWVDI